MKILFIGARLFDDVSEYAKRLAIETIITESNPNSQNIDLADKVYIVPRGMDEPKEIALKEDVDAIIPLIGIDGPLIELSKLKEDLETNYQIPVLCSNLHANQIAVDKLKSKEFFNENNIKTPDYSFKKTENISFPSVFKQAQGQGGKDIKIVLNKEDILDYFSNYDEVLIEEFIKGFEVSVEVLSYKGEYYPLVPVNKGKTTLEGIHPLDKVKTAPCEFENVFNEDIRKLAKSITEKLNSESTTDIDFIIDSSNNEINTIEMNTRPSGTRYLTAAASGIHPLNSLIDMAIGEFSIADLDKTFKNYFALEIPLGNFNGKRINNYSNTGYSKEFLEPNSWVVHGPENYERITISGENKEKAFQIAKDLNIDIPKI